MSVALTATLDISQFHRNREQTMEAVQVGLKRSVHKGADAAVRFAQTHHTHKRRTGYLTSSAALRWRRGAQTAKVFSFDFMNLAPYAAYVEQGTRPHVIRPKEGHGFVGPLQRGQSRRAKTDIGTHRVALRIPIGGGQFIFRAKVDHPGTPPLPFMEPASWEAGRVIVLEFNSFAESTIQRIWN